MKEKYEHDDKLRGIGFCLTIASMLYNRAAVGKEPVMKQATICKELGISHPCFYRHMNYDEESFLSYCKQLGLSRFKSGKYVYFHLDEDTYRKFMLGAEY